MRLDAVPAPRGGIAVPRPETSRMKHLAPTVLIAVALLAGCAPAVTTPAVPSAACGSASLASRPPCAASAPDPTPTSSGTSSGSGPIGSPSATPFAGAPTTVRLALDWTPNTDHTGFFVARHEGWYRDAGIDLQVLPYATATPETLLAAHQAECGISFQDSLTFAVAAGADIVSVAAILQKTASAIGVLASGPIQRPRDLDGKTYAGFGYPNEVPTLKAVIQEDGGTGDFTVATLDAAAYEALYSKKADFTIPFTAWEGVEATQRQIDLRYFQFSDYGFPEFYQVVLACDRQWLEKDPDAAKRFVGATVRGLQFSNDHPDEAAAMLAAENPGAFDVNPDLPKASQEFLAAGGYLVDANGVAGTQTLERWTGYSRFLFDQKLLTDASRKPLATAPDYAGLFTNDFLP
jgi:ABC-type nitrate/sulfonate/bicarbonate transport system substrate-binding protein